MEKINKFKKTYIVLAATVLFSGTAIAQNQDFSGASAGIATNIAGSLERLKYDQEMLDAAGCDANVWNDMVNEYSIVAQQHVATANQAQVENQVAATPEKIQSCYDQASRLVDNARRSYNTLVSIFMGGGMNSDDLYDYAESLVIDQACSQLNNYVAQTGIGSMVNQGNGLIDSMLNKELGAVGDKTVTVSDVMNNGGFERDKTGKGQIGQITSGDMSKTVNNFVTGGGIGGGVSESGSKGSFWDNVNPFK